MSSSPSNQPSLERGVADAAGRPRRAFSWPATAALLLAAGVGLGAFGAHGLRGVLDERAIEVYQTAVLYHLLHSLGMLAIATSGADQPWTDHGGTDHGGADHRGAKTGSVCGLLLAGIVLFSGSLYLLALSGLSWFGMITPLGGLAFIAAWIWYAAICIKRRG